MKAYEEDGRLVLCLEGSVNAENAARVDAEIRRETASHPNLPVCLDADDLTFISSSGLRILLRLRHELPQQIMLRNASPEVYSVFEVTGFTDLMEIRRKPREITVDGCAIIGRGAFGTVYRLDGDTIVKVYRSGEKALPMIEEEREAARKAFLRGVPTAIPFDTVRVGSQYGAVFEMINAASCNDLIVREPERISEIIPRFAAFLRSLHALKANPGELPDARNRYVDYLKRVSQVLKEGVSRRLEALIRSMPEDLHLLHGDAHLKNVMDSDGTLMLIDMDTLCTGNPVFEFAGLFTSYMAFIEDDPGNALEFHGIDWQTTTRIYRETLDCYLRHPDAAALREADNRIQVLGYLRFLYVLIVEQEAVGGELKQRRIQHAAEHLDELVPIVRELTI